MSDEAQASWSSVDPAAVFLPFGAPPDFSSVEGAGHISNALLPTEEWPCTADPDQSRVTSSLEQPLGSAALGGGIVPPLIEYATSSFTKPLGLHASLSSALLQLSPSFQSPHLAPPLSLEIHRVRRPLPLALFPSAEDVALRTLAAGHDAQAWAELNAKDVTTDAGSSFTPVSLLPACFFAPMSQGATPATATLPSAATAPTLGGVALALTQSAILAGHLPPASVAALLSALPELRAAVGAARADAFTSLVSSTASLSPLVSIAQCDIFAAALSLESSAPERAQGLFRALVSRLLAHQQAIERHSASSSASTDSSAASTPPPLPVSRPLLALLASMSMDLDAMSRARGVRARRRAAAQRAAAADAADVRAAEEAVQRHLVERKKKETEENASLWSLAWGDLWGAGEQSSSLGSAGFCSAGTQPEHPPPESSPASPSTSMAPSRRQAQAESAETENDALSDHTAFRTAVLNGAGQHLRRFSLFAPLLLALVSLRPGRSLSLEPGTPFAPVRGLITLVSSSALAAKPLTMGPWLGTSPSPAAAAAAAADLKKRGDARMSAAVSASVAAPWEEDALPHKADPSSVPAPRPLTMADGDIEPCGCPQSGAPVRSAPLSSSGDLPQPPPCPSCACGSSVLAATIAAMSVAPPAQSLHAQVQTRAHESALAASGSTGIQMPIELPKFHAAMVNEAVLAETVELARRAGVDLSAPESVSLCSLTLAASSDSPVDADLTAAAGPHQHGLAAGPARLSPGVSGAPEPPSVSQSQSQSQSHSPSPSPSAAAAAAAATAAQRMRSRDVIRARSEALLSATTGADVVELQDPYARWFPIGGWGSLGLVRLPPLCVKSLPAGPAEEVAEEVARESNGVPAQSPVESGREGATDAGDAVVTSKDQDRADEPKDNGPSLDDGDAKLATEEESWVWWSLTLVPNLIASTAGTFAEAAGAAVTGTWDLVASAAAGVITCAPALGMFAGAKSTDDLYTMAAEAPSEDSSRESSEEQEAPAAGAKDKLLRPSSAAAPQVEYRGTYVLPASRSHRIIVPLSPIRVTVVAETVISASGTSLQPASGQFGAPAGRYSVSVAAGQPLLLPPGRCAAISPAVKEDALSVLVLSPLAAADAAPGPLAVPGGAHAVATIAATALSPDVASSAALAFSAASAASVASVGVFSLPCAANPPAEVEAFLQQLPVAVLSRSRLRMSCDSLLWHAASSRSSSSRQLMQVALDGPDAASVRGLVLCAAKVPGDDVAKCLERSSRWLGGPTLHGARSLELVQHATTLNRVRASLFPVAVQGESRGAGTGSGSLSLTAALREAIWDDTQAFASVLRVQSVLGDAVLLGSGSPRLLSSTPLVQGETTHCAAASARCFPALASAASAVAALNSVGACDAVSPKAGLWPGAGRHWRAVSTSALARAFAFFAQRYLGGVVDSLVSLSAASITVNEANSAGENETSEQAHPSLEDLSSLFNRVGACWAEALSSGNAAVSLFVAAAETFLGSPFVPRVSLSFVDDLCARDMWVGPPSGAVASATKPAAAVSIIANATSKRSQLSSSFTAAVMSTLSGDATASAPLGGPGQRQLCLLGSAAGLSSQALGATLLVLGSLSASSTAAPMTASRPLLLMMPAAVEVPKRVAHAATPHAKSAAARVRSHALDINESSAGDNGGNSMLRSLVSASLSPSTWPEAAALLRLDMSLAAAKPETENQSEWSVGSDAGIVPWLFSAAALCSAAKVSTALSTAAWRAACVSDCAVVSAKKTNGGGLAASSDGHSILHVSRKESAVALLAVTHEHAVRSGSCAALACALAVSWRQHGAGASSPSSWCGSDALAIAIEEEARRAASQACTLLEAVNEALAGPVCSGVSEN